MAALVSVARGKLGQAGGGLGAQPLAFKMLPSTALEEERKGEEAVFNYPWLWC